MGMKVLLFSSCPEVTYGLGIAGLDMQARVEISDSDFSCLKAAPKNRSFINPILIGKPMRPKTDGC